MKKISQQPNRSALPAVVCIALLTAATTAYANVGMENVGFSAKSMGRAGANIAVGDDASVMNTNPALLANISDARADANLEMMFPEFGYRNSINHTEGKSPIYVIPSMGYAKRLNNRLVLGIAMFNEGGTGTDYGTLNVNNTLFGPNKSPGSPNIDGIEHFSEFGYMIVTPTVAYQIADGLHIGLSPQIGYGMLRMKMPMPMDLSGAGTGPFEFGAVDMDGTDVNFRAKLGLYYNGGRYGFGLAYTSKAAINADGDVTVTSPSMGVMRGTSVMKVGWPSSLKAGAFYDAGSMGRITGEVQRVNWSEYYNSIPVTWQFSGMPAQSFNMNIGMEDQTAWRIGYEYPLTPAITLRTGWAHGKNPIPSSGIIAIFNPIVEDHVTFGLGYQGGKNFEFNMAVVRGLNNTVTAAPNHPFPDAANSQTDMAFWSVAMQISYKW